MLGTATRVVGASRTDAGVHALRQVASLSTTSTIDARGLQRGLNALLPPAIRVLDARDAPPSFDARRSARGKRYAYVLDRGACADPFLRRYGWHVPWVLDPTAMGSALHAVEGKHDFSAFCASAGRGRTPMCTVRTTRVVTRKNRLVVLISADSFLHHMVRNLIGRSSRSAAVRSLPSGWRNCSTDVIGRGRGHGSASGARPGSRHVPIVTRD
jgi:tRNA pseudouridine38-40 synthase